MSNLVYLSDTISYDPNLPKGIALYRYEATESEELSLEEGDIIDILEEASDGWWETSRIVKIDKSGKNVGIVPYNYIRKVSKTEFEQIKNHLMSGNKNSIIENHLDNSTTQEDQEQQEQEQSTVDIHIDNETKSYHSMASLSDPLEKSSPSNSSLSVGKSNNGGSYEENYSQLQRLSVQQPKVTIKLNDIAKEGYLIKKGHIRKNWNVRWFQLKRNSLTYAKSPSEPKLSGTLVLTPDTEIDIATSMKRTNCFQIKIPIDGNKDKAFVFVCSAHSADDMESWIRSLNQAKNVK